MTSGDLLRRLFQSYKRRDDQAFEQLANQIVEDERAKHHNLLADELEGILRGRPKRNGSVSPIASFVARSLEELPRDRERNAVLLEVQVPRRTFDDILLSEENTCTLREIVTQFRKRDVLKANGFQPPRRLLFCGPPGCGKTVTAEAVASELSLPLLYTRFDAVISSFLGETAANIRKVFDFASRDSWVLLFDEFDTIGKTRDDESEHGELKRVVNSFLQILDGFSGDSLIIAATNHEAILDPALWRRFDEIIFLGPPSHAQIVPLLELKLRSFRHGDMDLADIADRLVGLTQADIERVCLDAMKGCVLRGERQLTLAALDKSLLRHRRRLAIRESSQPTGEPSISHERV
ncbi:MAG TPA: hypothetical protein DEV93_02400 [Chloroflexi bacterium]|nr:hypothetical protein [Chloroflexota bacterium]